METLTITFVDGTTKTFDFDNYEINHAGTIMIIHRRNYPDKLLPLFQVRLVEES